MYIIERKGWFQWIDDGDNCQGNRAVAKEFATKEEAEDRVRLLNEEVQDKQFVVVRK